MAWHKPAVARPSDLHICGCYFIVNQERRYLPQVQLKSHTTITPISYTTRLEQSFHNPNVEKLAQARFTFPLYDSVCVNGYTITYGDTILKSIVQQKYVAKKTYEAAVERGETAGLLDSLPAGVFAVTLGNVPPMTDIIVNIDYSGELKHDASTDGLRYTLPTSIAPRYGTYPGEIISSNTTTNGGISIVVDITTGKSPIRRVQSPSHPIAVSMGGLSTSVDGADFMSSQASATLTQGIAELSGDFVLQVLMDDLSQPHAILEPHTSIEGQRAIMATLVPKFTLKTEHPELVFIADQSGSMSGSKNTSLIFALKVFIKSLPFGARFNICAFGSMNEFLWPTSQIYSEENVNTALNFIKGFKANYGGTEIMNPIREAFKRRLKDAPLEVMILTDGEIWGEEQVFTFINQQIRDEGVDARVFALGIGQDVSHSLVEGIARAGNGFCQFVTQNEDTDQKVIRMLKGALFAHTKDYSLEVHYTDQEADVAADDFEIVERVNDCLVIDDEMSGAKAPTQTKPVSFFDTSVDVDKVSEEAQQDRYAHLPPIDTPRAIQAPSTIPPLFPFNRSTIYLLLSPQSTQKEISSITLRATSAQGPLKLTIPVQKTSAGTGIHQLAARAAIQDLEEGRGWLREARTGSRESVSGVLVKEKYSSRIDELVEREAVHLGEQFQVAGKWTSFVAIESYPDARSSEEDDVLVADRRRLSVTKMKAEKRAPRQGGLFGMVTPAPSHANAPVVALFGSTSRALSTPQAAYSSFGIQQSQSTSSGLFGASAASNGSQYSHTTQTSSGGSFGSAVPSSAPSAALARDNDLGHARFAEEAEESDDEEMGFGFFDDEPVAQSASLTRDRDCAAPLYSASVPASATSDRNSIMHKVIDLQTFSGAWTWSGELIAAIGGKADMIPAVVHDDPSVAATACAVAHLENTVVDKRDVWDMVVTKARAWLVEHFAGDEGKAEEVIANAKALLLAD